MKWLCRENRIFLSGILYAFVIVVMEIGIISAHKQVSTIPKTTIANAVVVDIEEETTRYESEVSQLDDGIGKTKVKVTVNEEKITAEIEEETEEVLASSNIKCGWSEKIELTSSEFQLLCATVYAETGHQSIDTQILAALCILNRVELETFPNTVYEVIYQSGAFEVTKLNLWNIRWDEQTEMAVTYALEENRHPRNLTCFYLYQYHSFGTPYVNIGNCYFTLYGGN